MLSPRTATSAALRSATTAAGCASDRRLKVTAGPAPIAPTPPAAAAAEAEAATAPVAWDTSLHLPLWVSRQEAEAIEVRVDAWVERLLEVGAGVRRLAGERWDWCRRDLKGGVCEQHG